ncbi:hypothetical protein D11S_2165 [Aggregatibacter actinomycetemcomitans D11S-1]|uniref:hypothetical protein n=2 Tax=Aggregatibacter actinomycetemcomitans TaxID=714 RepID=UPI0001B9F66C|nr:hypothetical protein [Aggregatibacter actinomycetemcomitans]ACX83516.1 hypothetical protein D11S_2165 [Aggregatibacter actinomycetemcomitans D11S-1]BAS49139.1 D12 class N6 adenine-specific DNA methyltransferase [Aggregatibacter actinomycetemcomitans NUM4039]
MFKQAPLPFVGQKRQFLKHFKAILNEQIPGDGEAWTIIDTFGGSGLLAHTAKQLKPCARVIYNDFDGYADRIKHIDDINRLRGQIAALLSGVPRQKRVTDKAIKTEIVKTIEAFDGYVDLASLASWLLFSGQQVGSFDELCRKDFWHCVCASDYPSADGYLDGVEVVSESFHTLLPRFTADPQAVFVLDPPYLCTKQESYKQAHYFDLIDFLRLVNITRPPYIFFSSTKSEFVRFIDYMQEDKVDNWQAFANAKRIAIKTKLNYHGEYEDNLVYKF